MATVHALPAPVSAAPWRPWMWSAGLHAGLVALLAGGMTLSHLAPPTETALADFTLSGPGVLLTQLAAVEALRKQGLDTASIPPSAPAVRADPHNEPR